VKKGKFLEKTKAFFTHLETRLKCAFLESAKTRPEALQKKFEATFEVRKSMIYDIIGEKTSWITPLFNDWNLKLRKSGLKINFKTYVSLTIFATVLLCAITLMLVPSVLFLVFNLSLLPAILFGIGGSLFAFALSIFAFYLYPIYRSDAFRRELEDELPFATSYMAILASAGVSPEKVFQSLSNLSTSLAVTAEAKDIVRDVNLFGSDIISALEGASQRTPSQRFREMVEGLVTTVHSGGNMTVFLREKSKEFMRLKRIDLKKFSDTLSILSEVYVTLLLTGPLFLVIMLVVMSMLGGWGFGLLSPSLLLGLLTYVGIPLGAIAFLIVLDAVSPRW
jgi:flagellar protein FlaJ